MVPYVLDVVVPYTEHGITDDSTRQVRPRKSRGVVERISGGDVCFWKSLYQPRRLLGTGAYSLIYSSVSAFADGLKVANGSTLTAHF